MGVFYSQVGTHNPKALGSSPSPSTQKAPERDKRAPHNGALIMTGASDLLLDKESVSRDGLW